MYSLHSFSKASKNLVYIMLLHITVVVSVLWFTGKCEDYGPGYGDEWLYYFDDNGLRHIMNFSSIPKSTDGMSFGDAYFYLYTRNNTDSPELITLPKHHYSIESMYFDELNDVNLITHGWLSTYKVGWLQAMKNALLREFDLNVIIVDWSELSQNTFYPWPALSTRYIGKRVAKFVKAIKKTYNIDDDNIHLIGHSLGAHVMGYAGMFSKGNLHRVTGLDPARPLFELPKMPYEFCLDQTDAKFVDIIHTAGGTLGYNTSYGHADFYPNNGRPLQPGCRRGACSHGRACDYFEESISYSLDGGFISYRCNSWDDFTNGNCRENSTSMGYITSLESRGDYYLQTRNESKFADTA